MRKLRPVLNTGGETAAADAVICEGGAANSTAGGAATATTSPTAATHSEVRLTAIGILGEACRRRRHWQNQGHHGSGTQNLETDHGSSVNSVALLATNRLFYAAISDAN